MQPRRSLIILLFFAITSSCLAQKNPVKGATNKPVAKPLKALEYGDPFTNQLAKSLDELLTQISAPDSEFDRKALGAGLLADFYKIVSPSDFRFPETYSSYHYKQSVSWEPDGSGETNWVWYGELMRQYKDLDLDKKAAMRKKYEDALAKIYGKHKTDWGTFALPWGNVIRIDENGYRDSTALILSVSFVQPSFPKPELQNAYMDNFKVVLYSGQKRKEFEDAVSRLYKNFQQCSFSETEQFQAIRPLFLDLASKSQRRAFGIYINYFDEKVIKMLKESMSYSQQEGLKKMSEEYLANYQNPSYSYLDGPVRPPDPVVIKPAPKSDNPCYTGQKTIEYNAMLETKLGLTRTFVFDCSTQQYMVAYIKSGKLHFGYLSLKDVKQAKHSNSDIFICSKCNGSGGMRAASYTYAYGFAWVREFPTDCNACWGKGFCPNGRCNSFGQ